MDGRFPVLTASVLLLTALLAYGLIPVDGSYQGQSVLDADDDLILHNVKEKKVSGHPELDIVSLETFDRGTRVEAYLTMLGDVSETFGYIYTMSIGGVEILFDNGTFQITGPEGEDYNNDIDAEVNGQQLTAMVPKLRMEDGDFMINGSATEYILDHTSEKTLENYYDHVEARSTNPISKYQMDVDDERNDVRLSYIDLSEGSGTHIDILSVKIDRSGSLWSMEMEFTGEPASSRFVTYEFGLGQDIFMLQEEELQSLVGTRKPSGHIYDGNSLRITFSGEGPKPGEVIFGLAREDLEGGSWLEDKCPENRRRQLDLFPCDLGRVFSLELEIESIGSGSLSIYTTDLGANTESALWNGMDGDSSGSVETAEVNGVISPVRLGLMDAPLVTVNGRSAVKDLTFSANGMDDGEISLGWDCDIETGSSELDGLTISLTPFRFPDRLDPEDVMDLEISIKVPEGYKIVPDSIEPDIMVNHLGMEPNLITISSRDPQDLDLVTTGLSFNIKKEDQGEQGDEPVIYEDVPRSFYLIVILIAVSVMIFMYVRSRKKSRIPPEDI